MSKEAMDTLISIGDVSFSHECAIEGYLDAVRLSAPLVEIESRSSIGPSVALWPVAQVPSSLLKQEAAQ